jgi:glycosyltransferase involved in cell wall biosynthesis
MPVATITPSVTVAVVIPVFNHAAFVGDAIRSLLGQTHPPDRIIVIDDGSTDGSLEAASAAGGGDPRLTLLSQANAGAHETLNRAIGLVADADFLGILNSDDLYEPERIESCLRCLERNPNAAVVATRLRMVDATGTPLPEEDPRTRWLRSVWQARPPTLPGWLGIANFTKTTSNLFGRAEYFRAHPFRDYRYVHDYYFALAAALADRLVVLDEELLRYRVHGANTIKSGPPEKLPREVLRMNADLLREFAPELAAKPEVRARMADYFRVLSLNYADFRLEPFLQLVARRFAELEAGAVMKLCEELEPGAYPELLAGKSAALKESLAQAQCERLLQALAASRWMALGRVFGAGPQVLGHAPTAQARLAALRKSCDGCGWYRLGRRLGVVYGD